MKKLFFNASLLLLTMVMVACNNNLDEVTENVTTNTNKIFIKATAASDADSRLSFADDGLSFNWDKSDTIAVKVGSNSADTLVLFEGNATKNGKFQGNVTKGEQTDAMLAYYPFSAADGVDLTAQSGLQEDAACNTVMFAKVDNFTTTPSFSFSKKISILKLNMDCPTGVTSISSVVVKGAYSKGELDASGNWTDCSSDDITIDDAKIEGGKISAYVVVIPGSKVKDLQVEVTSGTLTYSTKPYTSDNSVPSNNMVSIKKELVKKYVTVCGVKWALGNLMYESGTSAYDNFQSGWKIADDQWLYLNYDYNKYNTGTAYSGAAVRTDFTQSEAKYDHFNFGGIADSYSNLAASTITLKKALDIKSKMYTDSECAEKTTDFASAKYGDVAYWASNGEYRLPSSAELKKLRDEASISYGYYETGETCNENPLRVWGILFTNNDGSQVKDFTEKKLLQEDIDSGLFLPLAGRRGDSSETLIIHARMQGLYWSSQAQDKSTQTDFKDSEYEYSTLLQLTSTAVSYGFTLNKRLDRQSGFSIRPVYNK